MTQLPEIINDTILGWMKQKQGPLIVGICGAQGSGKSTLAQALADKLIPAGFRVAIVSLDDLYLPPEHRPVHIHPLFATRGVPGTHDVALGCAVFEALVSAKPIRLPRFDKANDRPFAKDEWPRIDAPADVVLFEGWCVGAVAQADAELAQPVNGLERDEDPNGEWRCHANAQLAGPYRALFAYLDRLIFLSAPSFEIVQDWRTEQEAALRERLKAESREGAKLMDEAQIARFIQHYERLTRHILYEMPDRADMTIRLNLMRQVL